VFVSQAFTVATSVNTNPYTLHPIPFTIHPTPYTLKPTPLHTTPCTLHTLHTLYTLYLIPHTSNPKPPNQACSIAYKSSVGKYTGHTVRL